MKRKNVYLLQEDFEVAENGWGKTVPCGTEKSPILYYVFGGNLPVHDEENNVLYYLITNAFLGHDEKRWDFFQHFQAIKDFEKYKFCYIVDFNGESSLLIPKEDVVFEFVSIEKYICLST